MTTQLTFIRHRGGCYLCCDVRVRDHRNVFVHPANCTTCGPRYTGPAPAGCIYCGKPAHFTRDDDHAVVHKVCNDQHAGRAAGDGDGHLEEAA